MTSSLILVLIFVASFLMFAAGVAKKSNLFKIAGGVALTVGVFLGVMLAVSVNNM